MKVTKKQLGKCQATVETVEQCDIYIEHVDSSGVVFEHHFDCDAYDVKLLRSYSSIVAILVAFGTGEKRLYRLPRSTYSVTTQRQVSKFAAEYALNASWLNGLSYRINIGHKRAW